MRHLAKTSIELNFLKTEYSMNPTPQLRYVVRNKQAIGFLLSAGQKGYRAFDQDGRPIGLFKDEDRAAKAVYEEAATDTAV